MKSTNPRDIITPDAFSVAPELLGIRLASPWRRLGAIAIDALLVAMISGTSLVVLLALVVALLLWRALAPAGSRSFTGRAARIAVRLTLAVFAFVIVLEAWDLVTPDREPQASVELEDIALPGLPDVGFGEDDAVEPGSTPAGDSLAVLVAANARLERRNERLAQRNAALERRAENGEADEQGPVRAFFGEIFDELGLGLGWFGFYFTVLTVLGRGQTPGKRLLGIRVIRLDARPVGWWIAFERFGGYAASFFSGTLGFAQILWDRNRQALHDKATETVVVRVVKGEMLRADVPGTGFTARSALR